VLVIADEVMCGFGRTGRWFAIEHYNVKPQVMTMGKGVTGGYFPMSITAVQETDVEKVQQAQGDFPHGGTFSHHAVGAATALATLEYLEKHDLIKASSRLGTYLGLQLQKELAHLPCIGDVRGLGMMWAIEFVTDRQTKEPFPPEKHFSQRVCDQAFNQGVILYPGTGSVNGVSGDHLMVAPPFVITEEQIDELISILKEAVLDIWNKNQ
jgi:hypothetical protein